MMVATALWTSVLCLAACAAAQNAAPPVIACNLKAIAPAERPRYNELIKRLRSAIQDRTEFPDGFSFQIDGNAITLREAAEWIGMERLCCPFLTFQLSISGGQPGWTLKLTGPAGVKELLNEEFHR